MPFISGRLRVDTEDGTLWTLVLAVTYVGRHGRYEVPPGYNTDFATVPRWLWAFTPPSGPWNRAAVLHDWLITDGLGQKAVQITSPQVDAEFRHALKACKVSLARRWAMWAGVRWAAALSPIRRAGWLSTLPLLLLVSALALLPIALVVTLLIVL